jgi:XTP/dITP diphosphohydrolase
MFKEITVATSNPGKLEEFNRLLESWHIKIIPQSDFNVPGVKEIGLSFIENALIKARHCAKYTTLPLISDDSGLCIPYLSGRPGIYSARYNGDHSNNQGNINKVLSEMNGVDFPRRKAYFYCVLVFLMNARDAEPIIATGRLNGYIHDQISGKGGFGYDPIFYLPNYQSSLAELKKKTKNVISHRARAFLTLQQMILRKYQN